MGKYKHGKPDEEIEKADLEKKIENSDLSLRKKAYVILLYWLGCRRSEPLVIKKEDIEEKEGSLYISIHYRKNEKGELIPFSRGKRGQAGGPTELPLKKFGCAIIKESCLITSSLASLVRSIVSVLRVFLLVPCAT